METAFLVIAVRRIFLLITAWFHNKLTTAWLHGSDLVLALYNLVTPDYPAGHVIPEGSPGHNGLWPKYSSPQEGDSRSPCPGLNALANHGILPRNGKNIKFTELTDALRKTYNVSVPLSQIILHGAAGLLNRDYDNDTLNLSDLSTHNMFEHDGSWCRADVFTDPHQTTITTPVIEDLLSSGTGPHGNLLSADLSHALGKRRVQARNENPQFSIDWNLKLIGAINSTFMLRVFGGIVADLRAFLLEERIPDGWEPRVRHRAGLTMAEANLTIFEIELGIKEEVDGSMTTPHQPGGRGSSSKS